MSYSTEAVILVGRSIDSLRNEMDEERIEELKDEQSYGITFVLENDNDSGYVGFTLARNSVSFDDLECFILSSQEDFKNETGLEANIHILASWS